MVPGNYQILIKQGLRLGFRFIRAQGGESGSYSSVVNPQKVLNPEVPSLGLIRRYDAESYSDEAIEPRDPSTPYLRNIYLKS